MTMTHRRNRSRRGRAGFTIIEVLATLVLMGIVLPVAMKGVSVALNSGNQAKRSIEAAELAQTKLLEITATGEWQYGQLSGDFGEDWPDYRWNAEVYTRDIYLSELTLRVTWPSRGSQREVALSTLVYQGGVQQQ